MAKFKYRESSGETVKKRAAQKGGQWDSLFIDELPAFRTSDGRNRIRILPRTWDDGNHYAYDVNVHYQVGADNQSYLCLKDIGKECCICDEREQTITEDVEYAKSLRPVRRCVVWVIDRNNPKEGPMLWAMPWTVDRDISQIAIDEETNEILKVEHPKKGFDVMFTLEGPKGGVKKYTGLKITRNELPISKSTKRMVQWLNFIEEHPVPDCLFYREEEYIASVFGSSAKPADTDGNDKDRVSRSSSKSVDSDDDLDLNDLDFDDDLDLGDDVKDEKSRGGRAHIKDEKDDDLDLSDLDDDDLGDL